MTTLDPAHKRALVAELLRRKEQRLAPIALSAAQQRLWLLAELQPQTATYNVPAAFRLRGRLDRAALERALNAIVRRHDVLRARVTDCGAGPAYVVDENAALELRVAEAGNPAALEDRLAAESTRPFDLRVTVPIRALLVRCGEDDAVLIVTLHHIATDGWSMGVFKRELTQFYAAYRAGETPRLAEPACTYADFVHWQRAEHCGDEFEDRLRYWRGELADLPPPLELAPGRGIVPATSAGALRARVLDAALCAGIEQLGRTSGGTTFSTLLAAFSALLARYTGRHDFIIGSAFAGRPRSELEELIGFFVNTLPLRLRIDADPPFAAWLTTVRQLTLDTLDRQDVPLQTLVEAVGAPRSVESAPLINVMFAVNNALDEPLALCGLHVTSVEIARTTAKFDLTLEVTPVDGVLRIAFEYRTALFDGAAIDALLDAFITLLADVVRDASRPLSHLALLAPAALARQLEDWNDTAVPLTGERIERLFERQAAREPAAVAIVDGSRRVTYGALNERANRLARSLASSAGTGGARIGICFERGANAVAAMLAILKAGGTYVPLDPDYPRQQLARIVADSGIGVVLTERRWCGMLAELGLRATALDAGWSSWATFPGTNLPRAANTDPAAYVMYTSGSSGTPKGVLVPHAGIERLTSGAGYAPLEPADAVAHAALLAFDASTFEIWAPLLNGARLVVVSKSTLLSPAALRAAIERGSITTMFVTTALAREIARSAPATFAPLRRLLVGGESLDVETVTRLRAGAPHTALSNIYGPTETTTFATSHPLDADALTAPIPIGRPIGNTRAYVLDGNRRPLPAGATGELYIGGPGVALGYLNDPARTAEKFVADPFAADPSARLYATGDRVRYRSDGAIEFLGRADGQIKRRGFRIEPGEIEAALRDDHGVRDAAAFVRDDSAGDALLVAYVAAGNATAGEGELMRRLRARLPEFMLPDVIVVRAELPLTPAGKVDRNALCALPLPARAARGSNQTEPPRNEAQAALCTLWQELLGVETIGIGENFFDLGGHSLLALRMLGEIERRYGVRVPAALLFEQPTIERLARAVDECSDDDAAAMPHAINRDGGETPLFFFHGSIGGGFYCRTLAQRLGPKRPLYAIRPSTGRARPPPIETMAARTVEIIKRIAPHGPYLLGGYCNGGLVAFETARRLRAAGAQVADVVLIDVPSAPGGLRGAAEWIDHCGARLRVRESSRLRAIAALSRGSYRCARLRAQPAKLREYAVRFARRALSRQAVPVHGDVAAGEADVLGPWFARIEEYVPRRYDGRITLLLTNTNDAGRGWSKLAPHVTTHALPGNHLTCITDFVDSTAQALAAALAAAQFASST